MANLHSSITFGLVNIPVVMNPVIKNNDTSFNQLHKKCGNRINYVKYCSNCKKEVKESDIIKGYEYEKDKYITFQKEELDKLKPENEREIEIISFIPVNSVDVTYFEKSYVLKTEKSGKAYTLFCEALKKSKLLALAKTVIGSKFYYCVLRFLNNQIIMTTLYFEEEVNIREETKERQVNEKELTLALKLIESLKGNFEPEKYKDEYQDNIKNAIDDKLDGKEIKGSKKKNKQKINDLMEALEKEFKDKMNIWKDRDFSPMLLKEIPEPFNSDEYIFELKFDGIRALCFASSEEIVFKSRNDKDITNLYPELKSIQNIVGSKKVIFDGEIVAFDDNLPSFSKLQERSHLKSPQKIKIHSKTNPVIFMAFDILYENKDITNRSLNARKMILDHYQDTEEFVKIKFINKHGKTFFQEVKKMGLEGIVAKKKDGTYKINKRTDDFIKIKNIKTDEFLIGGFKVNERTISLFLGEYIDNKLYYVGKCSVSKSNHVCMEITTRPVYKNMFVNFKEDINYIEPTMRCYVDFLERTKNNHLRHIVFRGLV